MYFRRSRFHSFSRDILERVGLIDDVKKFFEDESVSERIKNAYLKLEVKVNAFIAQLPDFYKTEIDVEKMEEIFTNDVRYDFEKNLGFYIRASETRGEVTDDFLNILRTDMERIGKESSRRLVTSLENVECNLTGYCEFIVNRHVGRFRRDTDCGDYDDDDDYDVYD